MKLTLKFMTVVVDLNLAIWCYLIRLKFVWRGNKRITEKVHIIYGDILRKNMNMFTLVTCLFSDYLHRICDPSRQTESNLVKMTFSYFWLNLIFVPESSWYEWFQRYDLICLFIQNNALMFGLNPIFMEFYEEVLMSFEWGNLK